MDAPSHEVFEYTPAFRDVVAKYEAAQALFTAQNERLISELTPMTLLLSLASLESHIHGGMHLGAWSFEKEVSTAYAIAPRLEPIVAWSFTPMIRRELARRGGKSKRYNALQGVIMDVVSKNRNVSENKLLGALRGRVNEGLITGIDDPDADETGGKRMIHYLDRGKEKSAPISGLKHRLTRAKRYVCAEKEKSNRECQ